MRLPNKVVEEGSRVLGVLVELYGQAGVIQTHIVKPACAAVGTAPLVANLSPLDACRARASHQVYTCMLALTIT